MFANALASFWIAPVRETVRSAPPKPRPSPVFIGDAVQPFGAETLLLAVLRNSAAAPDDESKS